MVFQVTKDTVVWRPAHVLWGFDPQTAAAATPTLNETWHERRLSLEISVTTQADGNHTLTSERGGLDQRLGLNTKLSEELNTDRLANRGGAFCDWQPNAKHLTGRAQENTPAFDIPEESALKESNSEDQTLESPQELEEKRTPASQHPLQTTCWINTRRTASRSLYITHDLQNLAANLQWKVFPVQTTQLLMASAHLPSIQLHPLFPSADRDAGGRRLSDVAPQASAGCFRAFIGIRAPGEGRLESAQRRCTGVASAADGAGASAAGGDAEETGAGALEPACTSTGGSWWGTNTRYTSFTFSRSFYTKPTNKLRQVAIRTNKTAMIWSAITSL